MRKGALLLLCIFIFSIGSSGCSSTEISLTREEISTKIYQILKEEEYSNVKNLKVLNNKDFEDTMIVVYSFDILEEHHVGYKFFKIHRNKIDLQGGGSGIASVSIEVPFTISAGGGRYGPGKTYCVLYGEIYDENIKKMRITFRDSTVVEATVENLSYLEYVKGSGVDSSIISIDALNENEQVIYRFPEPK